MIRYGTSFYMIVFCCSHICIICVCFWDFSSDILFFFIWFNKIASLTILIGMFYSFIRIVVMSGDIGMHFVDTYEED